MTISLTKVKSTQWQGNGLGTSSATWAVKGHEGWTVRQHGGDWVASREGRANVRSYTKAMLLAKLEKELAA